VPGIDEAGISTVDKRWPRHVPGAVAVGLRAQLAVQLYLDDQGTLGALNLYSTPSPSR
jgi:hypothetical protein